MDPIRPLLNGPRRRRSFRTSRTTSTRCCAPTTRSAGGRPASAERARQPRSDAGVRRLHEAGLVLIDDFTPRRARCWRRSFTRSPTRPWRWLTRFA